MQMPVCVCMFVYMVHTIASRIPCTMDKIGWMQCACVCVQQHSCNEQLIVEFQQQRSRCDHSSSSNNKKLNETNQVECERAASIFDSCCCCRSIYHAIKIAPPPPPLIHSRFVWPFSMKLFTRVHPTTIPFPIGRSITISIVPLFPCTCFDLLVYEWIINLMNFKTDFPMYFRQVLFHLMMTFEIDIKKIRTQTFFLLWTGFKIDSCMRVSEFDNPTECMWAMCSPERSFRSMAT